MQSLFLSMCFYIDLKFYVEVYLIGKENYNYEMCGIKLI